jgi:chromosome segregation ATPase
LGRDAGLAEYCQPHSGFRLGIEGRPYQGACGGAGEAEFLRAYQQGKQIHEAEAQIRRLDAILAINESERASLGERIGQKHTELGQRASRGEADAALRAELHELEETAALVAAEIDAIEAALREQHTELALLRQNGDSWLRHNP